MLAPIIPAAMPQLLLLLPGLDGTGRLFTRVLQRFMAPPPVEVMAYPPDPGLELDDLARLVESRIGARTATLIAESFSGPVALRVAARQLAAIEKLALIASFAEPPRSLPLALARLIPLAALAAIPPPRWMVAAAMLNGSREGGLLDEAMAVIRDIPHPVLSSRLRLMAGLRGAELGCALPVLAIQALHDRIVPRRALAGLRRACPLLVERSIAGPHLLLQSQPQACLGLLHPFLAG